MNKEPEFTPSNTPLDFSKYDKPYELSRTKILMDLLPYTHDGSAIDIGCGPGYFSKVLTDRGWMTTAIDSSSVNIDQVREYVNDARLGDAISVLPELPVDHYNLIIAFEIIEHIPLSHGEQMLENISRLLKSGGQLIITTPNRLSPEGLGGYYWDEKIMRRGKWNAWDATHVHIYSSSELVKLVKKNGFSIDRVIGYYYEGWLPLVGRWQLPFVQSTIFPFNRLGFNTIIVCRKK